VFESGNSHARARNNPARQWESIPISSSPQVVNGDLSSFWPQIKTGENRKEKTLPIQHGLGQEEQGREEDPWNDKNETVKMLYWKICFQEVTPRFERGERQRSFDLPR